MPESESGASRPEWLLRLARGFGLSVVLSAGGGAGWHLAWWQHTSVTPESLHRGVERGVQEASLLASPPGPSPLDPATLVAAEAQRMPEADAALVESGLAAAAPETPHQREDQPARRPLSGVRQPRPADEPRPPVSASPLGVLDPRDRQVLPPLAMRLETMGEEDADAAEAEATPTPFAVASRLGAVASYVVQAGDTLGLIAERHGVRPEWIQDANDLGPDMMVMVGQTLRVPLQPGLVHEVVSGETLSGVAEAYAVDLAEIIAANDLDVEQPVLPGQRLLVPGGVRRQPTPTPMRTATAGPTHAEAPPTAVPTPAAPPPATPTPRPTPPSPVATPAAPPPPTARPTSTPPPSTSRDGEKLPGGPAAWPLKGTLTQRFGEGGHTGIDIAAPIGAPIHAAAAGKVVIAAKVTHGYGWRVVIDHGRGYTTLYAHLSAFAVAEGDRVAKGQVIGAVGKTGLATGPHLHFEIAIGGRTVDPLKYLP